jgi:hypothetical protein
MFAELYRDPARLEQFMLAMQGISSGNSQALAEKFDFSPYQTVCDVGGATGQLCILLAARHPHLRCTSFDLPVVAPIAEKPSPLRDWPTGWRLPRAISSQTLFLGQTSSPWA